jgi:methylated-DNA-[protein]-cysteine S-methyltransferase
MPLAYKHVNTPIGRLTVVANHRALVAIHWDGEGPASRGGRDGEIALDNAHPVLTEAERQLIEYFAGTRTTFDLPLDPAGTPFQKKVWQALTRIPFGKTVSYRDVAVTIGSPTACRAVGAANGRNPIPIVVPCHRVIGAAGDLTGFGGGLETKTFLLSLEHALPSPRKPSRPVPGPSLFA